MRRAGHAQPPNPLSLASSGHGIHRDGMIALRRPSTSTHTDSRPARTEQKHRESSGRRARGPCWLPTDAAPAQLSPPLHTHTHARARQHTHTYIHTCTCVCARPTCQCTCACTSESESREREQERACTCAWGGRHTLHPSTRRPPPASPRSRRHGHTGTRAQGGIQRVEPLNLQFKCVLNTNDSPNTPPHSIHTDTSHHTLPAEQRRARRSILEKLDDCRGVSPGLSAGVLCLARAPPRTTPSGDTQKKDAKAAAPHLRVRWLIIEASRCRAAGGADRRRVASGSAHSPHTDTRSNLSSTRWFAARAQGVRRALWCTLMYGGRGTSGRASGCGLQGYG